MTGTTTALTRYLERRYSTPATTLLWAPPCLLPGHHRLCDPCPADWRQEAECDLPGCHSPRNAHTHPLKPLPQGPPCSTRPDCEVKAILLLLLLLLGQPTPPRTAPSLRPCLFLIIIKSLWTSGVSPGPYTASLSFLSSRPRAIPLVRHTSFFPVLIYHQTLLLYVLLNGPPPTRYDSLPLFAPAR